MSEFGKILDAEFTQSRFDNLRKESGKLLKNVNTTIKETAKKLLRISKSEDIPDKIKNMNEEELRIRYDQSKLSDKLIIIRELAKRWKITPFNILGLFISIGLITSGSVGLFLERKQLKKISDKLNNKRWSNR
jgi:hypothetical protein